MDDINEIKRALDGMNQRLHALEDTQNKMYLEIKMYMERQMTMCANHNQQSGDHHIALYGTNNDGSGLTYRLQAIEAKMAIFWAAAGAAGLLLVERVARFFLDK